MSEPTINQRLKFLIEHLSTSVRAFSEAIGDSYSNTQNYIGSRQLAPKHEYIAKVLNHFSNVNARWLLTGEGEPFTGEAPAAPAGSTRKNKDSAQNTIANRATPANAQLDNCQRDLEAAKKEAAGYQREIALLESQLRDKEEIITLLRASNNRSN